VSLARGAICGRVPSAGRVFLAGFSGVFSLGKKKQQARMVLFGQGLRQNLASIDRIDAQRSDFRGLARGVSHPGHPA